MNAEPRRERQTAEGHPPALIRLGQVMALTHLSHSTIDRMIKRGDFPTPVRLGERAIAWVEDEIFAWVNERANDRRTPNG